jgi:dephospho-CoA kinase
MKAIGLTGGIGMGKSTAAEILHARGVAVVDTDRLAREVVAPGQPALAEILQTFGAHLADASGHLRRAALAEIVFADAAARKCLEQITHPRIRERWQNQLAVWRGAGRSVAVVVIPLLYETGAEAEFESIICVACTAATQRERLLQRGWAAPQIRQRCAAQWTVTEKMVRAQHVVWTEGELEITARQLARIIPG